MAHQPGRQKTVYRCSECGASHAKWAGQCADCGGWNCLSESIEVSDSQKSNRFSGYAGGHSAEVLQLSDVPADPVSRISIGISELDRVLGGGLVAGSAILIGGDPGIGKSTLILQALANLS